MDLHVDQNCAHISQKNPILLVCSFYDRAMKMFMIKSVKQIVYMKRKKKFAGITIMLLPSSSLLLLYLL